MEYYSTVRKDKILPFGITCTDPENIVPREISQTEKANDRMISLTGGI